MESTSPHTTHAPGPRHPRFSRDLGLPRNAGKVGMALFLVALGMLFAASLIGYLIIRLASLRDTINPATGDVIPAAGPPLGSIPLPWPLWVSTLVILLSSMTIHMAVEAVRNEKQRRLRSMLVATLMLSAFFLLVQTPSLAILLTTRIEAATSGDVSGGISGGGGFTALNRLIFFLIVIHALHVLGGILPLIYITHRAHQGRYDHEAHGPVTCLGMYWHFLDGVWLVMFAVLLIAS